MSDNSIEYWQKIWLEKLRNGEITHITKYREKGGTMDYCIMHLKEMNSGGQFYLEHDVRQEWIEPLLAIVSPSKENKNNLIYDETKDKNKPEENDRDDQL